MAQNTWQNLMKNILSLSSLLLAGVEISREQGVALLASSSFSVFLPSINHTIIQFAQTLHRCAPGKPLLTYLLTQVDVLLCYDGCCNGSFAGAGDAQGACVGGRAASAR